MRQWLQRQRRAQQQPARPALQILIGSSGDAETNAVKDAAAAWAQLHRQHRHGDTRPRTSASSSARRSPAAPRPMCSMWTPPGSPTTPASARSSRTPTRSQGGVDDFYPSLRATFTYEGKLYCVPKDFSTLALQINTDLWTKAGLTDADVPTTWDQLTAVAQKLKAAGITPLAIGDTRDRIGAFMVQAGGWIVSQDGTTATADTPQNLQALQYVQGLLKDGLAVYPKQVDAGWGGEAFGKGKAAMTIEGNWIKGAMQTTTRTSSTGRAELPAGPAGQGHAVVHPVLGHRRQEQVQGPGHQLRRGDDHGRPAARLRQGVRRHAVAQSAEGRLPAAVPRRTQAFIDSADYAQGPVNAPKMDTVLADFDSQLQGLPTATRRRS